MQYKMRIIIPVAAMLLTVAATLLFLRSTPEEPPGGLYQNQGAVVFSPGMATPVFSHPSGFYSQDFYLTLTGAGSNETIRFTLDGSVPTANSPAFTSPVRIHSPAPTPANSPMSLGVRPGDPVRLYYNGMVVRARIFDENGNGSATVTQSYFVERQTGDETRGNFNMRVVSIAIEPEHFGPWQGMYTVFNSDIRHMAYVEVFYPDGTPLFSQHAMLRVAGNWSRREQKKSLRLNFNLGDGIVDNIDLIPDTRQSFYSPLGTVSAFRHVTLRTSDLHSTTIREALVDRIAEPLRPDNQNATPAAVFVNGEFWGVYCMREHRGRTFIANKHPGISEQSVTILDFAWNNRNTGDHSQCTARSCHIVMNMPENLIYPLNPCMDGVHKADGPFGPWLDENGRLPREHPLFRVGLSDGRDEALAYRSWMRMYNAITGGRVYCDNCMDAPIMPASCESCLYELDMSNNEDFEIVSRFVCMDNLIDTFIVYFHFDNWYWPGNNLIAWKTDTIYPDIPAGDGRWRFIVHDFDTAFGYARANNLNQFTTPNNNRGAGTGDVADDARVRYYHDNQPVWAVAIWRSLLENEIFRNTLAARYATYATTVFNTHRANYLINTLMGERQGDIGANFYRWNKHGGDLHQSVANWGSHIQHLRNFVNDRPRYVLAHIRTYYNRTDRPHLGLNLPTGTVNINWVTNADQGFFDIAGAQIRPDLFERDGRPFFNFGNFGANYLRGLPIEVTARPFEGYQFSHFEVRGAGNYYVRDGILTITPRADENVIHVEAVFEAEA